MKSLIGKPGAVTHCYRIAMLQRLQASLKLTFIFALIVFGGCTPETDWLHYRGDKGDGYTSTSLYPPLGRRWKLLLQKKPRPAKYFNPPIVEGDTLYFGSNDNNFYALDIKSGYQLWSFKTKAPVNSIPSLDENRVYFGSNDGRVYAVDKRTGQQAWSYNTNRTVQSLVLRYEDNIIFTSDLGRMYYLSLEGKLKHSINNPYWMHHTFQVVDDILYWAPRGINFGAYDIKKRRYTKWIEYITGSNIWYSLPAVDDKLAYFGISQYVGRRPRISFIARNRDDGSPVWEQQERFRAGNRMKANRHTTFMRYVDLLDYLAPAIWQDLVIFAAGDTTLRAFDKASGKPAWETNLEYPTSSAPTIGGDRIYLGIHGAEDYRGYQKKNGQKPRLVSLSARNGQVLWEMELEGAILSAPVISGNRLMFGTNDYHFHVLEEIF